MELTIIEDDIARVFVLKKPSARESLSIIKMILSALGSAGMKTDDGIAGIINKVLFAKVEIDDVSNGFDLKSIPNLSEIINVFFNIDDFLLQPIFDRFEKHIYFKANNGMLRQINSGSDGDVSDYKNLFKLYKEFIVLILGF